MVNPWTLRPTQENSRRNHSFNRIIWRVSHSMATFRLAKSKHLLIMLRMLETWALLMPPFPPHLVKGNSLLAELPDNLPR